MFICLKSTLNIRKEVFTCYFNLQQDCFNQGSNKNKLIFVHEGLEEERPNRHATEGYSFLNNYLSHYYITYFNINKTKSTVLFVKRQYAEFGMNCFFLFK